MTKTSNLQKVEVKKMCGKAALMHSKIPHIQRKMKVPRKTQKRKTRTNLLQDQTQAHKT